MLTRILFITILCDVFSFPTQGNPRQGNENLSEIPLSPDIPNFCLQKYARFLAVHDGYLSAEQVWNRKSEFENWEDFNITHQENEIWMYFEVRNTTSEPQTFYLNGQLTDYIALYQIKNQKPELITGSGYLVPYKERPIEDWGTIISGSVKENTKERYLFKLKSVTRNSRYAMDYALLGCAKLYSEKGYLNDYKQNKYLVYFFVGALFMMFVYNLCISFLTLYREYLLLSLYHGVTLLTRFFMNDFHLHAEILTVHDEIRNVTYLFFSLMLITYLRFSMKYLDVRTYFPRLYRLLNVLSWTFVIVFISLILSFYAVAYFLTLSFLIVFYLVVLWMSITLSLKGIKSALFILIGNTTAIIIGIFHSINLLNWITTGQLVVITTFLHMSEVVIFSFAVAYKLRVSKRTMHEMRHKNELQNERLRLEEKVRKTLEVENNQKSRSLTTTSIQLLNFNEKLKSIVADIDQQDDTGRKLVKRLEELRQFEDQWKTIKSHFESVHPDFFSRIERLFPDLSANEHRLLVFIKMKFSNKEIAVILNVTRGAVEQAKRRLNRKLGVDSNVNDVIKYIEEYIAND